MAAKRSDFYCQEIGKAVKQAEMKGVNLNYVKDCGFIFLIDEPILRFLDHIKSKIINSVKRKI